jgi:hypothetical protein
MRGPLPPGGRAKTNGEWQRGQVGRSIWVMAFHPWLDTDGIIFESDKFGVKEKSQASRPGPRKGARERLRVLDQKPVGVTEAGRCRPLVPFPPSTAGVDRRLRYLVNWRSAFGAST